MRAQRDEIEELKENLPPIARFVVDRRWLAEGQPPRLADLAEEAGIGLLTLDRQECKAYRAMQLELGEATPHPIYDPDLTDNALDEWAAKVRDGACRHIDVAKALRICTSRVRMLLGPRTRMMQGRMLHGVRAFFEHGCRCEVCRRSVRESIAHYDAGGEARTDVEPLDVAPCQESPRVYFSAGHHDAETVFAFCARVGIDVDDVRHAWWRKQRARIWWTTERLPKTNPVTVIAKRFPDRVPRSTRLDPWVRRWLAGDIEEEVAAAALGTSPGVVVSDMGWCDADGFPMPTKQATHIGAEWSRMAAP